MASLIYDSLVNDVATGAVDLDTDTFWVMLVTSSYSPAKKTDNRRDDVTNEVVGVGYSAGGKVVTATVTPDTANDRVDVTFSTVTWPVSTITARAAVLYKRRGGASSADELVFYGDFGSNVSTTGGTFTLTFTGPLRFQN